jgi:hypothetical protein
MLLLILTLVLALIGIIAIEFGQAAPPRPLAVWNDDVERRMLRTAGQSHDRW